MHPIIPAPMAGASTPELVAAASNAGGLGSFGAATNAEIMPMLAGQAYPMIRAMRAGELVQTLVRESADLFVGVKAR